MAASFFPMWATRKVTFVSSSSSPSFFALLCRESHIKELFCAPSVTY